VEKREPTSEPTIEPKPLPNLIRDLQAELRKTRGDRRWRPQLQELARRRIAEPMAILDWAMRDRRWSFRLAELMAGATARPRELAARLVAAIVAELEEEREMLAADAETGWGAHAVE
jgi:hypothetical protein